MSEYYHDFWQWVFSLNRHSFSQKICGDLVVNVLPQRINGAGRPVYHLLSFHQLMDHLLRWGMPRSSLMELLAAKSV